ncbi:M23/M56 family metallopeptidase [Pseudoduganella aquatica]|uniref:Peptidoglycan DD-metalloendopeptidase family protein n=1 Tax=Pseudoduganella aquatica TaxID=2660641 RepID=A0A7X4HH85_9BURK|nr:M23/M56 family metallopeptidase [Pseudoduganella aquatica]MYN10999.1 peptidoglycan DD-metalloendopeptidase family protein [Pseudoduganella aquatica]
MQAVSLFLLASASCVVAGALAWVLLKLAERVWPEIAAQRAVWLLAQLVVALSFMLALLPRSEQISVLPAIVLAEPEHGASVWDALDGGGDDAEQAGASGAKGSAGAARALGTAREEAAAVPRWLPLVSLAWLACYAAGLLYALARWVQAQRALRALLRTADRISGAALRAHAGFDGVSPYRGPPVMETPVPVSPMLVGLVAPRLLLPSHLAQFDAQQQQLIVAHELTHWRRRDHVWLHASLLLETLFWFNPVMRSMRIKMNWALELACDQQVLAGRPSQQRQSYAAALVAQLKLQQAMMSGAYATPAFGGTGMAALGDRIKLIRDGGAGALGIAGKALLGAGTVALLAASVLLQPAFAWRAGDVPSTLAQRSGAQPGDAGLPQWRAPLESARVSSFYGARKKPLPSSDSFHHGIDFAAKRGTAVLAPAAGTVVESTGLYDGQPKYGQVIVIDHGKGLRSMYAHLDRRSVRAGDTVAAGQAIGLSGATGRVSGPHLHLEVLRGGEHVDPAQLIANLDANASPSALRARSAALAN